MTAYALDSAWLAAPAAAGAAIDCAGAPKLHRVLAGAVDLFFTLGGADGRRGPLRPVCRVSAGELFLAAALPAELAGWQGRFVLVPGTRCAEVDGHAAAEELEPAVARWLGALARAVRPGLVPASYREAVGELVLADGETCATSAALAWLEVTAGRVRLMGDGDLAVAAGARLCLPGEAWLVADGSATLRPVARPPCAEALAAWAAAQSALLRLLVGHWAAEDADAGQRLALRRGDATRRLDGALRGLADLFQPARPAAAGDAVGDPVLAACRLAGRPLGIEFPPLPRHLETLAGVERLAAAVEVARVQKRRVALRGDWWREDAGPLVGFTAEDEAAVALLPRRGGYLAIDPATGRQVPVDAALAAALRPHAYGLFRAFPDRPLTLVDLLRLGLQGRRREAAVIVALAAGLGLLGLVAPLALGHLFDRVIPAADRGQLVQLLAGLAGVALATLGFSLFRAETLLRLEGRMEAAIQAGVWDRVLKLPVRFFRDYSAGDLAQRVNAINEIHQALAGSTLGGLLSGLFAFLNLGLLFGLAPHLGWLALDLVAVAVLVSAGLAWAVVDRERQQLALRGKLASLVLETLTGIAKLRVAAAEGRGFARWAAQFARARGLHIEASRLGNISQIFVTAFPVIAAAVIFDAVMAQPRGGLTTGDFVAFSGVFTSFFLQFVALSNILLSLLHVVPQLERARPILATAPENPAGPGRLLTLRGGIAVSNLAFRYRADGPAILDGISFELREGEFLAVVGPSGSGKSTLMRLLLGFERPEAGTVGYDGVDLADLDLPALRRQLGVVLQSGQLMPGDLYSNIVGAHHLTLDDAWAAARLCGLAEDIEAMPMGMHTMIGEGATTLSGGQRQRVLIARAIVRRPRVLLFDEATSALDNRTQELVSRSVERLKATRIVIAHRLSTIVNADRILVLDRGRVVQSGTYAGLMAQPGLFRELASRQIA